MEQNKELLRIDRNDLDGELIRQSQVFYDISEETVQAIAARDKAKDELDTVCSKISIQIRTNPPAGIKITEDTIASLVTTDSNVVKAKANYLSAKEEADRLINLQAAYQMRGKMLHDLTALFIAGYFTVSGVAGREQSYDILRQQHSRKPV